MKFAVKNKKTGEFVSPRNYYFVLKQNGELWTINHNLSLTKADDIYEVVSERQFTTEANKQHDSKALHIADVSKRFSKGAIWQNKYDKSIVKMIDSDWIGSKVRMTDGTVFSKIFLSKYYKHIS